MTTRERLEVDVDLTLQVACSMDDPVHGDCPNPASWQARWDLHCTDGGSELNTICEFHKVHLSLPVWICGRCKKDDIRLIDQVIFLERL